MAGKIFFNSDVTINQGGKSKEEEREEEKRAKTGGKQIYKSSSIK